MIDPKIDADPGPDDDTKRIRYGLHALIHDLRDGLGADGCVVFALIVGVIFVVLILLILGVLPR